MQRIRAGWGGLLLIAFVAAGAGAGSVCGGLGANQEARVCDRRAERSGDPRADIVLDTEWKVLSDGRLAVKQVRPFLRKAGK